jgi:hypothetical protein
MTGPRLCAHVTRLAQADQVLSPVGFLGRRELTEWPNVVDRHLVSDEAPAMPTDAVLFANDDKPDALPVPTSVRLLSTNPIGRIRPRLVLAPVGRLTSKTAELDVCADSPLVAGESPATVGAREGDRLFLVPPTHRRRGCVRLWRWSHGVHVRNHRATSAFSRAVALPVQLRQRRIDGSTARVARLDLTIPRDHA